MTLLLKVLLQQTDLDKPYTGGLGSYKLYVLLAHHFRKHLSLGGGTAPGEILLSFLYRYSDIVMEAEDMESPIKTDISVQTIIQCDGGEADINAAVKGDRCADLFGVCYTRILHTIEAWQHGKDVSFLAPIIESTKLKTARKNCVEMASQWEKISGSYNRGHCKSLNPTGNNSSFMFSKAGLKPSFVGSMRGPRGGLIPKSRPDLNEKTNDINALLTRGRKNRKNKKKQKRDVALKEFATTALL